MSGTNRGGFLIDIERAVKENKLEIRGVIHLGAHKAEEYDIYKQIGATNTIWVDANPQLVKDLQKKFKNDSTARVIQATISNKKHQAVFKIHNDTHTSSILDMDFIAESHPELHVDSELKVTTISLDELIAENSVDISKYNMLTIDVQGVEMEALEGSIENLKYIDHVYVEVETKDLYVHAENYSKIRVFLNENGFNLITEHVRHWYWGDCLYSKAK